MNKSRLIRTTSLAIVLLLFASACQKYSLDTLSGCVQKGPYINGTAITISELKGNLNPSGRVFSTQIADNKGSFIVDEVELSSPYIEIRADGYYYDEVIGGKSPSQLTLYGLADVSGQSSVNVNILTHLEKGRVEFLVAEGLAFEEAKAQAQGEILRIFGIEYENMSNSELLDITSEDEENAILLAISVMLQGRRSVADFTELLANINSDLKEDGILDDDNLKQKIFDRSANLNLDQIRSNLESRYSELGVAATISGFEQFIVLPLSISADITYPAIGEDNGAIDITVTGGSPPYTYEWSNGTSTEDLLNVSSGRYSLTISDSNNSKSTFTAFLECIFTDSRDGTRYKIVEIGDQTWFAENLYATRLNDGIDIEYFQTHEEWMSESGPGYCWFNNDKANYGYLGAMYKGSAVRSQKLCPPGWHIPNINDWNILLGHIEFGGEVVYGEWAYSVVGSSLHKIQSTGFCGGSNETGFNALSCGYVGSEGFSAHYYDIAGFFWLDNKSGKLESGNFSPRCDVVELYEDVGPDYGFFVRCVKD